MFTKTCLEASPLAGVDVTSWSQTFVYGNMTKFEYDSSDNARHAITQLLSLH